MVTKEVIEVLNVIYLGLSQELASILKIIVIDDTNEDLSIEAKEALIRPSLNEIGFYSRTLNRAPS